MPFNIPAHTTHIAFIDETGEYGLETVDPKFPVFATCAVTSTVKGYLEQSKPKLEAIKQQVFGAQDVIFHGHKIRQKEDPFHILKDQKTHDTFMAHIVKAFGELDGIIIAAAIRKDLHKKQYSEPENPFFLSLKFVLERLAMHWGGTIGPSNKLLCVFEKRGRKEDARTKVWFDAICAGNNFRGQVFHFESDFQSKDENIPGHQYADLSAYTVARYAETKDETRKDWIAIKGKIRKSWFGKIEGYGLKIFP